LTFVPGSATIRKVKRNVPKNLNGGLSMKRTVLRSKTGKKLYAVRDKKGRFVDIQSYKKAHGQDIKRKSKKEK